MARLKLAALWLLRMVARVPPEDALAALGLMALSTGIWLLASGPWALVVGGAFLIAAAYWAAPLRTR